MEFAASLLSIVLPELASTTGFPKPPVHPACQCRYHGAALTLALFMDQRSGLVEVDETFRLVGGSAGHGRGWWRKGRSGDGASCWVWVWACTVSQHGGGSAVFSPLRIHPLPIPPPP